MAGPTDSFGGAGDLVAAGSRIRAAMAPLGVALAEERDRWALWVPVGLGIGVGLYFALPFEPAGWTGPAATLLLLLAAVALRMRPVAVLTALAALAISVGFAAAQLRTASVAAPVLQKRISAAEIRARVVSIERLETGRRLVLDDLTISRLRANETPARIRLVDRRGEPALRPGERVRLRAVLMPPPRPVAPGAFDFARRDYFLRIGATGFIVALPERFESGGAEEGGFGLLLARLRQTVAGRIIAGLDGAAGGVAAALLTGDRGAIPKETLAALRDSGLAHSWPSPGSI